MHRPTPAPRPAGQSASAAAAAGSLRRAAPAIFSLDFLAARASARRYFRRRAGRGDACARSMPATTAFTFSGRRAAPLTMRISAMMRQKAASPLIDGSAIAASRQALIIIIIGAPMAYRPRARLSRSRVVDAGAAFMPAAGFRFAPTIATCAAASRESTAGSRSAPARHRRLLGSRARFVVARYALITAL